MVSISFYHRDQTDGDNYHIAVVMFFLLFVYSLWLYAYVKNRIWKQFSLVFLCLFGIYSINSVGDYKTLTKKIK